MKTNEQRLVMQSAIGQIRHPYNGNPYYIQKDGQAIVMPALGGISYNVKIGDGVYDFVADHLEPGVTIKNQDDDHNNALNVLTCIGNSATVMTGDAKGAKGIVTGKHGGCEHVIVYFPQEDLEKMAVYDTIQVRVYGQGMQLTDHPDVMVMNIDPSLLEKLGITEEDGVLTVPIAAKVPAYMMGSGIGENTSHRGDYDITTSDVEELKALKLDKLRFGDIVLLEDADNGFGRAFTRGAVSIGIVIHGDCVRMGHGPGVTTIMTCKTQKIKGVISENANIADILGL